MLSEELKEKGLESGDVMEEVMWKSTVAIGL